MFCYYVTCKRQDISGEVEIIIIIIITFTPPSKKQQVIHKHDINYVINNHI